MKPCKWSKEPHKPGEQMPSREQIKADPCDGQVPVHHGKEEDDVYCTTMVGHRHFVFANGVYQAEP